ncbi:hypothetical protein LX36DRAFT_673493 [Colletotrichum falcatum]|nr:hypothetical protein LX36DRAFT_673493 [Colletotrichum falcatum]
MSGYYSNHHAGAGSNAPLGGAWRHFDKRRRQDTASYDDEVTNTLPKRPRMADSAPGYGVVKLSHEAYTVGWVCALHLEMAAAEAMLDEEHEPLAMNPNDSNVYTFGRIGPHNVVIACLPSGQYGTNSAAVVANNMTWSFPSIRIGLMVGIGGGVPGKVDIRLGDVVVSNPTGGSSGVVQYDFGKAVRDGRFEHTGTLNKPPQSVLAAVSKLRANHESRPNQIPAILANMERNAYMSEYLYRSMDEDRLFQAFYEHTGGDTCDECDVSKVVKRDPRPEAATPKIHYGIIASGNQVIKHAQKRDRLAEDLGIICFEMEAAGLMDNFPCLVVRGICDYSDSHKAKRWQRYAAATAAAYAKELLYLVTPHTDINYMGQATAPDTVQSSLSPTPPDHRKPLLDSLKFNQIDKRQANIKAAHAKTCEWLVKHPDYAAWMDRQKYSQHHGFLWIRGKPGAGKSTIMKFAFTRAKKRGKKGGFLISFFFNARGEGLEKTTLGMYRSLLYQLLQSMPDLQTLLDDPDLSPLEQPESEGWGLDQLRNLFRSAVRRLGQRQLTCFIDALDECADNEVSDMVSCFEDLGQYAVQNDIRFYVCFSSRHYPYIDIVYGQKLILEDQTGHANDLDDYVRSKLRAGSGPKSEQVISDILRKASGVFMWVVLVVDILNIEYGNGRLFAVEERLKKIPSDLSQLFQDILTRDQKNMEDLLLCIQLLLYSQRPLRQEEYYFAIATGLQPDTPTEWDPEDITHEFMDRLIVSSSKGLAETTKSDDRTVQFIHESVRDFLLKDDGLRTLWPDMADNFEGRSHDRLKDCCHTYSTQVDISEDIPEARLLLKSFKKDAQHIREKLAKRFPFLEYATNHVLRHAEAAAAHAIPQELFFEGFAVDRWIQMNNLFEESKPRRHKPGSTSLLYIAAAKGLTKLVEMSLRGNFDVDTVGGRYQYPLLAAIIEGNEDTAHVLLDCIANKLQQNKAGKNNEGFVWLYLHERSIRGSSMSRFRSPSSLASPEEEEAEFNGEKRLLGNNEQHTTPSPGDDRQNLTPSPATKTDDSVISRALIAAAEAGKEETARLLLHAGADVRVADGNKDTPLHVVCGSGRFREDRIIAMVKLLVENSPELESTENFLIEAGADVHASEIDGETPLFSMAQCSEMVCLDVLLSHGANINHRDKRGRTPLFKAIKNNSDYVQILLDRQADITITDHSNQTPLFELGWGSKADSAKLNNKGQTFLHVVCSKFRISPELLNFIQWVFERGFEVDIRDDTGRTPLMDAVQGRHEGLISLLMRYGADPEAADNEGQTPLSTAIRDKWQHRELLLKNIPDATTSGLHG